MSYMTVANEIRRQILARGIVYAGSWGARQFVASEPTGTLGCLAFRVSGRKLKGTVAVSLMPDDTYTVQFFNRGNRNRLPSVVAEFDRVYCDQLVDVIDRTVEA